MVTLASIQTGIQLADNFTAPLMHIISSVNMAVSHMEELNNTMNTNVDTASYEGIRSELSQASVAATNLSQELSNINTPAATAARSVSQIGNEIQENTQNQQRFNQGLQSGVTSAKTFVSAIAGLSVVRSVISTITGQLDAAMNRMDTMSNYSRAMTAISGDADVAGASLERLKEITKGTAYGLDTAASSVQNFVTRGLGVASSVDQMKKWADAVAFYGNGTNEQLANVTDALGKMLSKGKVEMDQLDRLTDAGINAVGIYAQATKQSTASVQNDLSKGKISAQNFITTVSTAFSEGTNGVLNISGAAKEAGGTWATSIANAKAAVTRGLISLINGINEGLTNAGFGTILDGITSFGTAAENTLNKLGNYASIVIGLLGPPLNMIREAGTFITDNWSSIAPVVYGVIAALAAYCIIMGIVKGVHLAYVAVTTIATMAQAGFNAALAASPVTWIIIMFSILIGVLVMVANHIAKTGNTATTTFGVICGGVNVVIQFFKNFGLTAANIALAVWEAMKACATNLKVAFGKAISNVQSWFYSLLSTALNVIENICVALNRLPFVEFDYSGISAAADDYAAKAQEAAYNADSTQYVSVAEAATNGLLTFDVYGKDWASKAYKSGAAWGDGISNKVKKVFEGKAVKDKDYSSLLKDNKNNTGATANNTAKTANALAVTAEDLKYLRELAEVETVNRFTTAKITVNQTNHNNINNDMDLDGVTEHLRSTMEEQMLASAQGVY